MPDRQTVDQMKAEIAFRAKLARQHVSDEVLLPDYYTRDQHDEILRERIDTTVKRMSSFAMRGIRLSPFLELGAERGQRSLVLTNDFGAEGVAIDISYHQLKTMEHFAALFGRDRLPLRVCCDANHLPFRNGSFPFVFCYQFLHHFPSLDPIVVEINRVMSAGHFYFDEEPYKRVLKLNLYRQRDNVYAEEFVRRNRYLRLIQSFLSDELTDEEQHGVLENHELSLASWRKALTIFADCEVELSSIYGIHSGLHGSPRASTILTWLLGGLASGLCRKETGDHHVSAGSVEATLACPECVIPLPDGGFDRPPLARVGDGFECPSCQVTYPSRDGILFLMPKPLMQQLYPDL